MEKEGGQTVRPHRLSKGQSNGDKVHKRGSKIKKGELPALHWASSGEDMQDKVPRVSYAAMYGQLAAMGVTAACSSTVPRLEDFLGATALARPQT